MLLALLCCLWGCGSQPPPPEFLVTRVEQTVPDELGTNAGTVFLDQMTSGEIGAAIAAGKRTIIIPTGGLERNGPHVVTDKHNLVVRVIAGRTAVGLGDALVTSVLPFVPQGDLDEPSGLLMYPGTVSISHSTYEQVLTDIATSHRLHGFVRIVFIGDSLGNQAGMSKVAQELDAKWPQTQVYYSAAYYEQDMWSYDYLKQRGFTQQPDEQVAMRSGVHTDLHYEAILAAVDPTTIHAQQRLDAGDLSVHGVHFDSVQSMATLGELLISYRADIAIKDIEANAPKR